MEELTFTMIAPDQEINGPLDLLLKYIVKKPENILVIRITDIINQYLAALQTMEELHMDVTAEFIRMAAELMLIKTKMMLPRAEDDEDPLEPLFVALWNHQQQIEATAFLTERFGSYGGRMLKDPDEVEIDLEAITEQDLKLLTRAFRRMLHRNTERQRLEGEPVRKINTLLAHRVVPVEERVFSILRYLFTTGECLFEDLLFLSETRSEMIASFAAILELVKVQRLRLRIEEQTDVPLAEPLIYFSLDHTHRRRKPGETGGEIPEISIT